MVLLKRQQQWGTEHLSQASLIGVFFWLPGLKMFNFQQKAVLVTFYPVKHNWDKCHADWFSHCTHADNHLSNNGWEVNVASLSIHVYHNIDVNYQGIEERFVHQADQQQSGKVDVMYHSNQIVSAENVR